MFMSLGRNDLPAAVHSVVWRSWFVSRTFVGERVMMSDCPYSSSVSEVVMQI